MQAEVKASVRRWGAGSLFEWILLAFGMAVMLLVALILAVLIQGAWPSIRHFGLPFVVHQVWDPVSRQFGALPFIFGTVVTSVLALALSLGVSLGAAIYLAEFAPRRLRQPMSFFVELLAAVPSIVYGLWGLLVLAPWLLDHFETPVSELASRSVFGMHPLAFVSGPPVQVNLFVAGVLLAIMIAPIITAVSRDVLCTVAASQREGAIALGATHWEALRTVLLRWSWPGIIGAVILGLGRALGETMAVTMVIGNRSDIPRSIFSPGYTLGSVLVNEFNDTSPGSLHLAALVELGLLLFVVSVLVNGVARLLVGHAAKVSR